MNKPLLALLFVIWSVWLPASFAQVPNLPASLQKPGDKRHVLVEFYADWCGTCQRLSPVIERFAKENPQTVRLVKLDIDKEQHRGYAWQYQVNATPSFYLFTPTGTPVFKMDEVINLSVLEAMIMGETSQISPLPASAIAKIQSLQKTKPLVLVSFHQENCKPCDAATPVLKHLEGRYGKTLGVVKLMPTDLGASKWAKTLSVKRFPTYVLVNQENRPLFRASGNIEPAVLMQYLELFADGSL